METTFTPLNNGGYLYGKFDILPLPKRDGGGYMVSFVLPDMPMIDLRGKLERIKAVDDDWLTTGLPQTKDPLEDYQSAVERYGAER